MIAVGHWEIGAEHAGILLASVGGVVLLLLWMLAAALGAARRAARAAEPMAMLAENIRQLALSQEQLRGGLQAVSETQTQVAQTVELRLSGVNQQLNDRLADNALRTSRMMAEMQERMQTALHGSAERTSSSLVQLQERLATIDRAQDNIKRLSGDVLGLQDILSNRQTRGAFGEIQLRDILSRALPPDGYVWQATLGNGRRVDCLIRLPDPPGAIAIDSKFPLEAYERLRAARTDAEKTAAARDFRTAVRKHVRDIAERYIIEGETADGALMFLPSEAVYAELHANFTDLVQESFAARVWIVSPTTCMATLNTMRAILKDARLQEQAGAIRTALRQLHRDIELVVERAERLNTHFAQARADLDGVSVAAARAGKRAIRLEALDFDAMEAPKAQG